MPTQALIKRLSRASGQLQKVLDQLENEGADPIQIGVQLKAAANALMSAKNAYVQELIEDRLHRGIGNAPDMPKAVAAELAQCSGLL